VRHFVRECGFTACYSRRRWNDLLADRGHHTSSGQNLKLLPFAGDKVTASGKVYKRGGSKALVIEKIEAQATQQ